MMAKGLEKRILGNTGAAVTFLGFGALEIGRDWGLGSPEERKRPEDEEADDTLNSVLDLGINLIDTARAYHRSEERIGRYISHRRNEYFLASKCGEHSTEPSTYYDFSYEAVKSSIDLSLKTLKTDCIDLMQIHFGPEPERVLETGETLKAMQDARDQGKVKFLGASIYGQVAKDCIESGAFDVMQLDYSLLNTKDAELIELCGHKKMGVLLRGGLGYGRLTPRVMAHLDKETPSNHKKVKAFLELLGGDAQKLPALALLFIYENSYITSVLAGTRTASHVRTNINLLEESLDPGLLIKAKEIANS